MRLAVVAVVAGLVAGGLGGGRLANLPTERLRWPSLSLVAVVLYWAPALFGASASAAVALVLFSYLALLSFASANVRLAGMAVVALGLATNAAVIATNEGMPVDPQAVVAAGVAEPGDTVVIELGTARRWQADGDQLVVLSDIVPVPVVGEVVSFGDLVIAAGLANVAFRLLCPGARGRRPSARTRPRHTPAHPATA